MSYFTNDDEDIVTLHGDGGWVNVGPVAIRIERSKSVVLVGHYQVDIEVYPRGNEVVPLRGVRVIEAEVLEMGGIDPDEDDEDDLDEDDADL